MVQVDKTKQHPQRVLLVFMSLFFPSSFSEGDSRLPATGGQRKAKKNPPKLPDLDLKAKDRPPSCLGDRLHLAETPGRIFFSGSFW